MQKPTNRLVFVAAMFNDQSCYSHQVRNVGNSSSLSHLGAMQSVGVLKSLIKSLC
jgi:hypothetical protein